MGAHKGLVRTEQAKNGIAVSLAMLTDVQLAREAALEQVKVALLISRADRKRYGKLKDELGTNYLLGTDQYPNTFMNAVRILANYQHTRAAVPNKPSGNNTGIAFLQLGGQGGCGGEKGDRRHMQGQRKLVIRRQRAQRAQVRMT